LFLELLIVACVSDRQRDRRIQSFLLLLFKKEGLACLRPIALAIDAYCLDHADLFMIRSRIGLAPLAAREGALGVSCMSAKSISKGATFRSEGKPWHISTTI
jgi:hypothetical protein